MVGGLHAVHSGLFVSFRPPDTDRACDDKDARRESGNQYWRDDAADRKRLQDEKSQLGCCDEGQRTDDGSEGALMPRADSQRDAAEG